MKTCDIVNKLGELFPVSSACQWDQCHLGLITGRQDKEIHRIYVALDATYEVIEDAVSCGADMLITHHPLVFQPIYKATDEDFIGERVMKLIQADMCYYAIHTNYDVLRMGQLAADKLELMDWTPVDEEGVGCIGDLKSPKSLAELGEIIKECFGLDHLISYGDLKREIRRVAVVPGSGGGSIRDAIAGGAEVLLTGDISHHEGIDAVMQGLNILDGGHYGTEYMFIHDMAETLREICTTTDEMGNPIQQVEVIEAPVKFPFFII